MAALGQKTSDTGRTVRQRIVDALDALLRAVQDGGNPLFVDVLRGDLESIDNALVPIISIDWGTEEMTELLNGCSEYEVPTFFHFRYRGQRGLDEHDAYLYYLGLVQQAVLADHNLGGLTIDIKEDSNAHTIIGVEDVIPGGMLAVIVKYRTRLHNPYKLPHEAP